MRITLEELRKDMKTAPQCIIAIDVSGIVKDCLWSFCGYVDGTSMDNLGLVFKKLYTLAKLFMRYEKNLKLRTAICFAMVAYVIDHGCEVDEKYIESLDVPLMLYYDLKEDKPECEDMCINKFEFCAEIWGLLSTTITNVTKRNLELENKLAEIRKLYESFSKQRVVKEVVKVADEDKVSELYDKIAELEYQLEVAKAVCADRGKPVEIHEQEEEIMSEVEDVDISDYRILVITADQHSGAFDYDCLDLMAKPECISRLKSYDIVVLDTKHMSHPAYFAAKTECQKYGVKYLHYGKRDKKLLNALIVSTVKSGKI